MPVLSNKSALLLSIVLVLLAVLLIGQNLSERVVAQQQAAEADDPFGAPAPQANNPFGQSGAQNDPFGGGGGEFGGRGAFEGGEFGGRGGEFERGREGRFGEGGFGGGRGRGGFSQQSINQTQAAGQAGRVIDQVLNGQRDPDAAAEQAVFWAPARSENEIKLEEKLNEPLRSEGLDFTDTPLVQVIDFLRSEYGLEIQLDTVGMDELGIGTDEPVSVNLRNISLRSALRLMLTPLELTTIYSNEVLLITTEEEAQSRLAVAAYPVRDIAGAEGDQAALRDTLISVIGSESWAANGGGEAEVRVLSPGVLVISQTQQMHREVLDVLNAIRRARAAAAR